MLSTLNLLIDICRFQKAPQDLPSSHSLKYATICGYVLVGILVSLINQSMNTAIASVVIDTALMLALAYAGLWVRTFENRTTQTITALAGTGILFGIFAAPIMYLISYNTSDEVSIASFVFLILVMWQISVIGHIMRHALSIPFWAGFGISLFYIYTSFRVMSFLVVVSTGQAQ